MVKSVMIDGPKNGEVLTTESPISDIVCFTIPRLFPMPWGEQPDPMSYIWPIANYRRIGRVLGRDGAIDVYEFLGMT